jgi:hypothetical protein
MAQTISASGQEFCASQPSRSGFCDATLGVTGLCAVQPSSNGTFCQLAPVTQSNTMLTTLASAGRDCPSPGRRMSAEGVQSLVDYMAGFLSGFTLTVVQGKKSTLQCIQEFVSFKASTALFCVDGCVALS